MNNVDKAMELARKYFNADWAWDISSARHPDDESSFKVNEKEAALRTHLEAMEADRVRLLEAAKKALYMLEAVFVNAGDVGSMNELRAAIAQSEAQS